MKKLQFETLQYDYSEQKRLNSLKFCFNSLRELEGPKSEDFPAQRFILVNITQQIACNQLMGNGRKMCQPNENSEPLIPDCIWIKTRNMAKLITTKQRLVHFTNHQLHTR